jgi:hypothetical protein
MNPESKETEQSFNLPQPRPELGDSFEKPEIPAGYGESQTVISLEQGLSADPRGGFSNPGLSVSSDSSTVSSPVLGATMSPLMADDGDLIEKEWVEKAKEIVARTRHDPYSQNKEMNQIRVDYLKKRYNKDIRLSED